MPPQQVITRLDRGFPKLAEEQKAGLVGQKICRHLQKYKMDRFQLEIFVVSALLATCCTANQASISSDIVLSAVDRTVDISSHLPKITSSVTVENTGSAAAKSFLYAVDPNLADSLSFIGATVSVKMPDSCNIPLHFQ